MKDLGVVRYFLVGNYKMWIGFIYFIEEVCDWYVLRV